MDSERRTASLKALKAVHIQASVKKDLMQVEDLYLNTYKVLSIFICVQHIT